MVGAVYRSKVLSRTHTTQKTSGQIVHNKQKSNLLKKMQYGFKLSVHEVCARDAEAGTFMMMSRMR